MNSKSQGFRLNPFLVFTLAMVLGAGFGVGASMVRVSNEPVEMRYLEERTSANDVVDVDVVGVIEPETVIEQYPKVEVFPSDTYNFGTMVRDSKQQHTFVIRNVGKAPLTLEYIDSTCKCTVGDLDKTEVAPFESANVTLEWTAVAFDLDFRESARIRTNDHRNETISLSVYGKVQQIIRPVPSTLVLTSLSQQASSTSTVTVYAYRDDNFEVLDPYFTNLDQDYFELEVHPLTDQQVSREPNAKSGVELVLKSKVGIPAGPFQQSIRMETNLPDVEILEIPIRGSVGSDISVIAGQYRYHKQRQRFMLDPISGKSGKDIQVFLLVKGPRSVDVELTPMKADPDFMEITIGERKTLGKNFMYPLHIRIPPGTRPTNRKGSKQGDCAEFTIKTTHPDVPEIRYEVELYVY